MWGELGRGIIAVVVRPAPGVVGATAIDVATSRVVFGCDPLDDDCREQNWRGG